MNSPDQFAYDEKAAKGPHDKTVECPSLLTFEHALREGWPERIQEHVLSCDSCQRTLGVAYRLECPDWYVLAEYKGLRKNQGAVNFHVEHDGCTRCKLRLESDLVKEYARELAGAKPGRSEVIRKFLKGVLDLPHGRFQESLWQARIREAAEVLRCKVGKNWILLKVLGRKVETEVRFYGYGELAVAGAGKQEDVHAEVVRDELVVQIPTVHEGVILISLDPDLPPVKASRAADGRFHFPNRAGRFVIVQDWGSVK